MTDTRLLCRMPILVLLCCCFAAIDRACGQPARAPSSSRVWSGDYGQALERARRERRPMMLVFRCVP